MANLEVLALDEATPQIRAPGSGDGYLMPRPLTGASNVLDIRNGITGQIVNIYNTYTDASNYEACQIKWDTNVLDIGATKAGTGQNRTLRLRAGTAHVLEINSTSGETSIPQGLKQIGANSYHEMAEMSEPAAPSANRARVFVQDNGAGKTQLMVRFPSGVSQQIAIEP